MSNEFGVHSEVGKLRKVIVHRPDLSLKRLTPSNHDELLSMTCCGWSVPNGSMTSWKAMGTAASKSTITWTCSAKRYASPTRPARTHLDDRVRVHRRLVPGDEVRESLWK